MFKDYDKYLSASLKVYLFVLVVIFIMKLVGLDYFGLDVNNPIMMKLSDFCLEYHLTDLWYAITMIFYMYMFVSISCNDNKKRTKIFVLITSPLSFLIKYIDTKIEFTAITSIIEIMYIFLLCFTYVYKYKNIRYKRLLKNCLLFIAANTIFQLISCIVRVKYLSNEYYNFIINIILDFDYILMLIIFYKLYFRKEVIICSEMEVGSSSLKKINLKTLLTKLQEKLRNFRKLDKVTKLTYIIYFTLSLIWNTLNVVLILFVAKLNQTFIECIFILTSFWLTKRTFGKAFHLSSMLHCFIVSNLTYYTLNRITTPLGISIFIPIMLGVGLSYVTSKLVKKAYKPLYRGMPEELFEETILKVVDKDSIKYKICYEYFVKKKNAISLSIKYNYTEAGIKKIKDRINNKIKELN